MTSLAQALQGDATCEPMRALTLWQPWASLVAEAVKWIETRSWRAPAAAIGQPLAIAAGARWPDLNHYFPPLCQHGCWRDEANCPGHIMVLPTITDPAHQRPHRTDIRDRVPRASQTPTVFWPTRGAHAREANEIGQPQHSYAPLSAVVATCTLTDCVPIRKMPTIGDIYDDKSAEGWFIGDGPQGLALVERWPGGAEIRRHVEDQRPFGDFTPGRYAWLLSDIVKLPEPVPAKGRQRLWRWTMP